MELLKWQNVIVEWVNCLNLSKPVQTIADLKNEDFFRKLLLFITPADQNASLDRSVEDISLTEFLKKYYPAYRLDVEPTLIQDDIEICNICSLLLHYCCFIDGRQELTAPLCKELNTSYQFHIKSFLEDLQESHSITRDLLSDAITNINKYSTPTKFAKSPFDSPKLEGNTPLIEFLKTPLKKQQVYDSHKKEIKLLQAQLDLERFEKADLQEEVNLQYEKNTKLDKIISIKQSEISRLRSELLTLESRTPPSNTKTDGRLENKRLRDEIASLEKFIKILHKEQEEVQNERDKARERLRKVEETCNDWQSRALNSERQCSKISEENEFHRGEIIQLREKCEELSLILKELNAKNVCDESYEIDHMHADFLHNRSGSIDYDSLAHTVVDVQLIDAQEENKDLRKQLGELEVNTTELSTQVNQLQLEITKIMDENKVLVDNTKHLSQKISDTEKQFEKCRQTLKLTQDEKENLNTCIVELEKKLSETEFNLSYYENESERISKDLESSLEINNNLNEQLSEKIKDFNNLLLEKSKLLSKLEEFIQKILHFETENEKLKEFCDEFNKVLDSYLIKFETELKEHSEMSIGNNISKLQNLMTALEHKIQYEIKNSNSLSSRNSSLQDEVTTISMENGLLKDFLEKFNQIFESCLIKFENELKQYIADPATDNDNISKLQNLITFLETKIVTDAKNFKLLQENSNSLLDRITNLQDEVTTLYNTEVDSQKEKSNLKICLEDSKTKIQQLDEEINNNNKLLLICKSTIEEKSSEISSLKDVLISKDKLIEDLNKEKCHLISALQTVEIKLSEEVLARGLTDKKLNTLITTLQEAETRLLLFEENNTSYKSTIEEKSTEISSLKDALDNKDKYIIDLDQKILQEKQLKDIANNEIDNMKTIIQVSESKILELKTDNTSYKSTIEEKFSEISSLKDALDNKDKYIKDLDQKILQEKQLIDIANNEIDNMKTIIQVSESKILEFKTNIEEKCKEICDLKDIVLTKDINMDSLNSEKNYLISRLESTENILSEVKDTKEQAETEIETLKSGLRDFASKIQDLNVIIDSNNKVIESYEAVIEEKSNVVASREKYIEDLDKEKTNLATILQTVENKLSKEKCAKELVEKDFQKINDHLIERENCIRSLEIQKIELENNVESLIKEILNEKNCKIDLEKKCSKLQTIITKVEQQMQILQNDKSKLNQQLENVERDLDNLQRKNKDLTKSNADKDNHLQNLEKQKQNLNAKKEKLEKELQAAEDTTQVLKSKLEEMTKSVEEKTRQISKLELEKINFQNHIVNLEEELSKKTKQKDEIKAQLQDITKLLNQKETCIKYLENDKNTIQEQLELLNKNLTSQELELSNKITDQLQKNIQLQSEIDILNQNFSMINIEVSTIVNMLKSEEDIHLALEQIHTGDNFGELSKTISNLKNNICSLIFEKRRLDSETTILQQQISDLEHLKSSVEENHAKIFSESTKKIKDLTEDKERYKSHMETYRKKLDDVQTDLEKLLLEHSQIMTKYKIDVTKLQEKNNDLEEEIRQLKLLEHNMTIDLLSIKTELKETITNYQRTLETQEDMKQKNLQLSEEKSILALKLDQVTDDCTHLKSSLEEYSWKHDQKLLEIQDIKNDLNSHVKIIEELKEKISAKDNLVVEQDQKINKLNFKLTEFVREVQILNEEKNKFISQLAELGTTLNHLEQTRKEISEEMEQKIIDAEETMDKMKIDFNNKIEDMDKERLVELEIKKQLENSVESLTKQLADISSEKNNLITLCKESHNKIHSIYTIVFENKEDKKIIEQLSKLQQQDKQLESLSVEKEIVGKEFDFIANEITILKKTFKQLSNYEILKSDYGALINKYNQLSPCEADNNTLKIKLSNLQLENTRYQKQISEKEVDHKSIKDRYEEEIDLMKATCANWQKIIIENEAEHKKLQNDHLNLKQKFDTEYEILQKSNIELQSTVFVLEEQIKRNNSIIAEHEIKYQDLNNKYDTATKKISTLDPEILNLQDKINNYKKIIEDLESDNIKLTKNFNDVSEQYKIFIEQCKQNHTQTDKDEVAKLRSGYSDLMTENSRLQLDCTVLKKTVEDRNNQLSNLTLIKDSYEKLLEENNKVNMELDTLRYKRTRDKEEFKRVFEESNVKSDQQIQEVRSEYEEKLKKMKDKIVKLYREEVEKEKKKVCTLQQGQAEETISALKSQLWLTGNKFVDIQKENEKLREQLKVKDHHQLEILETTRGSEIYGSRDSVCSLRERRPIREIEERRTSTLPRDMKASYTPHSQQIDIIEESVTISRKRRSITAIPKNLDPGLKMEDEEGEFFNNTYLADLKAGRCIVSDRDSVCNTNTRISELQFRNSLCPPHLKSSYPAETQFASPGQCKEEDIKMGSVDLDDSMSSSLLPGEKFRTKKGGQTLYKKPGPPTPSKNGGRLSLQGNEVHPREVLREHNPGRTTSTPSRIKALFTRSGASSRDTEVGTSRRCAHSLVPFLARPPPPRLILRSADNSPILTHNRAGPSNVVQAIVLMLAVALSTYCSMLFFDL